MVADCYRVAVGSWGIQPSEFWDMTQQEWYWLFDVKRSDRNVAFGLSESDLSDLYELIK